MPARRTLALVNALPADAAHHGRHGWTNEHELAASVVEMVDRWGRILAMRWGAKARDLPKPPEIKHPGRRIAPAPKPVEKDPGVIRRFFETHMKG